jgi:hypothetical protein
MRITAGGHTTMSYSCCACASQLVGILPCPTAVAHAHHSWWAYYHAPQLLRMRITAGGHTNMPYSCCACASQLVGPVEFEVACNLDEEMIPRVRPQRDVTPAATLYLPCRQMRMHLNTQGDYNPEQGQWQNQSILKNGVFWVVTPCGSQKTPFFIVTAVKTSNLPEYILHPHYGSR